MAPSRRKGASKAAAAAATRRQWKVGDLVLAKVKGFPAWPATVSEPEKWGYSSDWKKVLVYFFGTKQIAFCNPADVEEFTEEKKISLLGKRQGRGSDFVRAVQEIVDCYEKLKENNRADRSSSVEAPVENAGGCDLNSNKIMAPDLAHCSALKLSNSLKPKVEQSPVADDVGALTEVDSLNQRGASEEPADNTVGPCISLPYTYTLRKKSRSSQPQRCASQKKISVQVSRTSLRFDSQGSQNEDLKCSDKKNSGDGAINGFWDGPLRRAKRSKRSPDGSAPNIGSSPVCVSNGTVEDNGSEVAMAESETLSNNEGSATESNHKHEQIEIPNESCGERLELSRRLDLQSKTAIVRKKRNPGRRRVSNDAAECASRVDQEVNMDTHEQKESSVLPSTSCENVINTHPKEEGDEHLPLVKRARVRMGKLLSEEQRQFDFLSKKSQGKPVDPPPSSISLSREPDVSANHDSINIQKKLFSVPDSIACSPEDNCTNVPDTKSPEKACITVVNEPVACLGSNSCTSVPENKPQPRRAKTSQTFGCAFDVEAALPPLKRLHRALEAMSANTTDEKITSFEEPLSGEADNKGHLPIEKTCPNALMEDVAAKNFVSQDESLNNNTSYDDCSEVPKTSDPPTCEIVNKLSEDIAVSDSATRILGSMTVEFLQDMEQVTILRDNAVSRGSGHTGLSDNVVQEEASRDICISKDGEEGCKSVTENNKVSAVHSERDMNAISSKEAMTFGGHDGTSVETCDRQTNLSTFESVKLSADENNPAVDMRETVEEFAHTTKNVNMESSMSPSNQSSLPQTCHGLSVSGHQLHDKDDVCMINRSFTAEVHRHEHASQTNDIMTASDKNDNHRSNGYCAVDAKLPLRKLVSVDESKSPVASMNIQAKSRERINLAEVKAALASLELTLGSLTRTKESIGKATRIAVDCVKFSVATEVVELLVNYLEKESSLYKRVDLFFLVDSIAQCCRSLKDPGEVGGSYVSAVKETLARMLSAAAPAGHAAKENRRQCLKVLRLWLERRILPDSIIRQHIRELESQNCSSSTGGFSRRMCRTERSFDDPLRDMEGMFVDEYGSNSSFQLPGFCMPRMLKEEDDGSDSDGGSFEAVTPEHDPVNNESREVTALPAIEKHRHILEDVDGELEMEDVAPCCDASMGLTGTIDNAVLNTHLSEEQFTAFIPPLPHDIPPQGPPLPTSPPPPRPLPPPPPLVSHVSTISHINVDSQLHVGRNNMQETISSRPPAPGMHHPLQMPESTSSCSFNSYPLLHNPAAPGNNIQQADANLYAKTYNLRPPYPSPSNQFSYFQADQQIRPQRDAPAPSYYDRPHYGQNVESCHFYADQDGIRPPRHELTDCWGYGRPTFPGPMHSENDKAYPPMYPAPMCEPTRPHNHGWNLLPRPVHHRNRIPHRPPCDGAVPVAVRAPGCWRPR